jgi:hypothetical protein
LHNADALNQQARQESLGQAILIQDKQPSLIRSPFKHGDTLYVQGFIPVLRERYQCTYDQKRDYKPDYRKVDECFLREKVIFGIVTNQELGYIPPVTLCRPDTSGTAENNHIVETFFFESMDQNTGYIV